MQAELSVEKYRMDMEFVGANISTINTEDKSTDYIHYASQEITAYHYKKVTYKNLYPGIDWVIYTTDEGLKYDFIVHPNADPSQIKIKFNHHTVLKINEKGQLVHGNKLGRFIEDAPISFQENQKIESSFHLDENILSFKLGYYDKSKKLIIDPVRIWGTYYGGASQDMGTACVTDALGNVYLSGYTRSTSAIASGGYQNTLSGFYDAMLVKFNSNGIRLWATYFGGSNNDDFANACAVDISNNIYIAGHTSSTNLITTGGHQNTFGGTTDAFLVKFNPSGTLVWSTFYGGSLSDKGMGCASDALGNIYLTGETSSTTNISTVGAHQTAKGSVSDGFLVKFNSSGVRQWATYYGGNGNDYSRSCYVDGIGNVYIAGESMSTNSIAISGFQNTNAGGSEAFLVKFSSGGDRQWATYYGGSAQESGWSCVTDASYNVYLIGNSNSVSGISSAGHQNTLGGLNDCFIVKFNSAGLRLWASYYGGTGEENGRSCSVDATGNVFISGITTSTTNISYIGHQNTFGGGQNDAFIVKFNASGIRQWASYYGGSAIDESISCATDPSGNVFIAGYTQSASSIASGGHQNTQGDAWDGFLVKFLGTMPTISTGGIINILCAGNSINVPFTVSGNFISGNIFTAQLSNAFGSFSNPINIGTLTSTNSGNIPSIIPFNIPNGSGYRIRVIASSPVLIGSDNGVNLLTSNIVVNSNSQTNIICYGENTGAASVSVNGSNPPYMYNWTPGTPSGDGTSSVTGLTAGNWTCIVTDAIGCTNTKSFTITQPSSVITGVDVINACDSYTWINGFTYTSNNNNVTYVLSNINGCDSVVTLNLTIQPSAIDTQQVTAINSFSWIDGNTYTNSTNAVYTVPGAHINNCDSIFYLNLTILNGIQVLTPDVVTTGGDYFVQPSGSLSITIGEPVIETLSITDGYLTQGFQQPHYWMLSIEEQDRPDINIMAYPNPTNDFLQLLVSGNDIDEYFYQVYSMSNQLIREGELTLNENLIMDVSAFSPSTYLLKVFNADYTQVKIFQIIKI